MIGNVLLCPMRMLKANQMTSGVIPNTRVITNDRYDMLGSFRRKVVNLSRKFAIRHARVAMLLISLENLICRILASTIGIGLAISLDGKLISHTPTHAGLVNEDAIWIVVDGFSESLNVLFVELVEFGLVGLICDAERLVINQSKTSSRFG